MPPLALQLSEDTEAALIARWRTGDRAADHCLLRRQIQPLRRYFDRRVACRADAEEDVELSRFVRAIATKLLLRYRRDDARARFWLEDVQPDAVQAGEPSAISWICQDFGAWKVHGWMSASISSGVRRATASGVRATAKRARAATTVVSSRVRVEMMHATSCSNGEA